MASGGNTANIYGNNAQSVVGSLTNIATIDPQNSDLTLTSGDGFGVNINCNKTNTSTGNQDLIINQNNDTGVTRVYGDLYMVTGTIIQNGGGSGDTYTDVTLLGDTNIGTISQPGTLTMHLDPAYIAAIHGSDWYFYSEVYFQSSINVTTMNIDQLTFPAGAQTVPFNALSPNPQGTYYYATNVIIDQFGRVLEAASATQYFGDITQCTLATVQVSTYGNVISMSSYPTVGTITPGTYTNPVLKVDANGIINAVSTGQNPSSNSYVGFENDTQYYQGGFTYTFTQTQQQTTGNGTQIYQLAITAVDGDFNAGLTIPMFLNMQILLAANRFNRTHGTFNPQGFSINTNITYSVSCINSFLSNVPISYTTNNNSREMYILDTSTSACTTQQSDSFPWNYVNIVRYYLGYVSFNAYVASGQTVTYTITVVENINDLIVELYQASYPFGSITYPTIYPYTTLQATTTNQQNVSTYYYLYCQSTDGGGSYDPNTLFGSSTKLVYGTNPTLEAFVTNVLVATISTDVTTLGGTYINTDFVGFSADQNDTAAYMVYPTTQGITCTNGFHCDYLLPSSLSGWIPITTTHGTALTITHNKGWNMSAPISVRIFAYGDGVTTMTQPDQFYCDVSYVTELTGLIQSTDYTGSYADTGNKNGCYKIVHIDSNSFQVIVYIGLPTKTTSPIPSSTLWWQIYVY